MPAKITGEMIKTIKKILALAVVAAASISCSAAFLGDETPSLDGDMKIIVTGVASDVDTSKPLPNVLVTFSAFAENSLSVLPLISKTVSTDSKGVYTVEAFGFSQPVTCTLTAESTDETPGEYKTMTNKIVVKWSGNSYDGFTKTFYVNDCNFQMEKN